jgi:hypothetical protein
LRDNLTLTTIDKSKYFRGLLILIRKDHKVSVEEKELMMNVGTRLGFEKRFCETAINEILENEFIEDEAPIFSATSVAESFILDGLTLAISDSDLNPNEIDFLRATLNKNNLAENWFSDKLKVALNRGRHNELEIEKFLTE